MPSRLKDKVLCVLQYTYTYIHALIYCVYFTGIFYAVVRQISVLFIDNKDSVVCILQTIRTTRYRKPVHVDLFLTCTKRLDEYRHVQPGLSEVQPLSSRPFFLFFSSSSFFHDQECWQCPGLGSGRQGLQLICRNLTTSEIGAV